MMKKLSILFLALVCAATVSAQHQRRVLLEEFTNASCPPCAAQNPTFNAVVAANIQYLTPIKYQTNWPGVDPMNAQTQSDVAPRVSFYGVNGVPNLQQNGTADIFPLTGYTSAMIQAAYNTLTPVTMSMTHALNATYDSIFINVSVTSDNALTGNFKLRVAVLEDEILFATAPGTNGEKEFFQIMRKMLPNGTGTTTGNFTAGQTKTYSFAWKLVNIYNLNQLSVAAFLQNDGTKEVYQSFRSEPLPTLADSGVKILAENVLVCAPGTSASFFIRNTGDSVLTNATIRYRQGTGAWSILDWTGNLLPGETESVHIPSIIINGTGTVTLEVKPINSNLGVHPYLLEAGTLIKYSASFDAAQQLPISEAFESVAFPPPSWAVSNTGTNGWKLATNAGAGSANSARCHFFNMPKGEIAVLNTPKMDLSAAVVPTHLRFDHAYAYKNVLNFDSLWIQITSDCGQNWETLYKDGKLGLSTAPIHGGVAWIPEPSEWRANDIDISSYNGQSEVVVRFVGKSGAGNNLFIDNLNVTSTSGTKELSLSAFNLVPNPTRDYAEVRFGLEKAQKIELLVYNAEGALVQSRLLGEVSAGDNRVVLNASALSSGSYRVVLQGTEGLAQTQWVVVK